MDERNNLARGAYEWLDTLATCFAFLMLVFFFVVKTYTVSGDSMYPTLEDGSSMLVLSAAYSPEQGDIVVLEHAGGADRSLVKRVVATGGQTVHIDDSGLLTVDGEPFLLGHTMGEENLMGDVSFPLTVPEGHIFVLGDNRAVSLDSRYLSIGCPAEESVVGKAFFVYSPSHLFGGVS